MLDWKYWSKIFVTFFPPSSGEIFAAFAFVYFREMPTWRTGLAFLLIALAAFLALPGSLSKPHESPSGASRPVERAQTRTTRPSASAARASRAPT